MSAPSRVEASPLPPQPSSSLCHHLQGPVHPVPQAVSSTLVPGTPEALQGCLLNDCVNVTQSAVLVPVGCWVGQSLVLGGIWVPHPVELLSQVASCGHARSRPSPEGAGSPPQCPGGL